MIQHLQMIIIYGDWWSRWALEMQGWSRRRED